MFRVNHDFLYRGKRYKEGQLIPNDHTATIYRTQFLDAVKEIEVEEIVEEAPPEDPKDPPVDPPKEDPPKEDAVKTEAPKSASTPSILVKPKTVVPPSTTVKK